MRSMHDAHALHSLKDAHLQLQPVENLDQVVHISQQLVGGGDLLGILVRVVLFQEGEAVHVAIA